MASRMIVRAVWVAAMAAMVTTARLGADASDTRLAEAAMKGDRAAVTSLLKGGADVNGAQGDGMTALLWAAERNDTDLAKALLAAGASVKATIRLGGYTPIFLASRNGNAPMIDALIAAGADAKTPSSTGTTPLMLADASGSAEAINLLLDNGAEVNARESTYGETPLMFAAANNRVYAIRALVARGGRLSAWSRVLDMAAAQTARGGGGGAGAAAAGGRGAAGRGGPRGGATPPDGAAAGAADATAGAAGQTTAAGAPPAGAGGGRGGRRGGGGGGANGAGANAQAPQQAGAAGAGAAAAGQDGLGAGQGGQAAAGGNNNGDDSRPTAIDFEGGLTPLLFAARQGHMAAVRALVEAGADVNQVSPGDKTSPLLMASINGHFDIGMFLLDHGANPDLASTANTTPLYGALGVQYAPHAFYPQPTPAQEKTSLIQYMTALLEHGANPNVKLAKKLWYTGYNFDQAGVDAKGSTAFWRAAQAADVDAMRLLVAYGADPTMMSDAGAVRAGNGRGTDTGTGAAAKTAAVIQDGVSPLAMASGAGYDGNFQVLAPGGFMPAVKYLVEDLGMDPRAADFRGYTLVHNAAFRGDNEMIQYLVAHGVDPTLETKSGQTAIDLANGPVQRIQPFPDTIKLLEKWGVVNHHKCVSCGGSGG